MTSGIGVILGLAAGVVGVDLRLSFLKPSALLVLFAALLAMLWFSNRILAYRFSRLDVAILVFVALSFILELINAHSLHRSPEFYTSYNWAIFGIAYFTVKLSVSKHGEQIAFLRGFSALAPIMAVLGLLQAARVQPVTQLILDTTQSQAAISRLERGESFVRATGLIGHWTGFGSYLVVMTVAIFVLGALCDRLSAWNYISLSILGLAVFSTFTFSVIIAFVAIIVTFFFAQKRIITLTVIFGVSAYIANWLFGDAIRARIFQQYGENTRSLSSSEGLIPESLVLRGEIWRSETIPAIMQRPFTGWGQGVYINFGEWTHFPNLTWRSPESQWLGILMQEGVLGLLSLLAIVGALWSMTRWQEKAIRVALVALLATSILTAFTVPQFTNAGLPLALVCLFGAVTCGPKQQQCTAASKSARTVGVSGTGAATG